MEELREPILRKCASEYTRNDQNYYENVEMRTFPHLRTTHNINRSSGILYKKYKSIFRELGSIFHECCGFCY